MELKSEVLLATHRTYKHLLVGIFKHVILIYLKYICLLNSMTYIGKANSANSVSMCKYWSTCVV